MTVTTLVGHEYLMDVIGATDEDESARGTPREAAEAARIKAIEDAARQPVLDVLEWITAAMRLQDVVIPVNRNVPYTDESIREFIARLRHEEDRP